MTDDVFATRGTLAAAIKPRETTEDDALPDIDASRLAEDVAYRLACRELVASAQREYIATQDAARRIA